MVSFLVLVWMCIISGHVAAEERYFRIGLGLDRSANASFNDVDCNSVAPQSLYGCGTRNGVLRGSAGDFGKLPVIEFGLGYRTDPVRLELLAEYRHDFTFEGEANFLDPGRRQDVRAGVSSMSGMMAGFVDISALGLPERGQLTPFLGAGVGVAYSRIGQMTMTFPTTQTQMPGGSRTNFTWMATAGVSIAVNERARLDLAWRYSDLGEIHTPRGAGQVVRVSDGSQVVALPDLAPTKAKLTAQGIRISLRYPF